MMGYLTINYPEQYNQYNIDNTINHNNKTIMMIYGNHNNNSSKNNNKFNKSSNKISTKNINSVQPTIIS